MTCGDEAYIPMDCIVADVDAAATKVKVAAADKHSSGLMRRHMDVQLCLHELWLQMVKYKYAADDIHSSGLTCKHVMDCIGSRDIGLDWKQRHLLGLESDIHALEWIGLD